MSDDPDSQTPKTPGFGDLESPFLFVPHGAPEPTEWMRKHPGWVKFPATFVPRAPAAVRTIPGTNRPWPLDERGQPWPKSRFGQPLRPLDEYPPGVRAPGEGYTGPIADPDEAVRACMATRDVLAQAAKYAADPDAPIKAYLSVKDVWERPWKYVGHPSPKATAPVRPPDASAPPAAQQALQPPAAPSAASSRPDPLLIPAQGHESGENHLQLLRSPRSTTPQRYPAPVNPLGVFVPGTPENEAWVQGAGRAIGAVRGVIGQVFNSQSRDEGTDTPDSPHGSGKIEGLGNKAGATADTRALPALPPNPDDLLAQGWKETSRPSAAESGHRTFEHPQTGEVIRFDKGRPGQPGFEGQDHYHRLNPNRTGKRDQYLDQDGNPVARGSTPSHLLPRS